MKRILSFALSLALLLSCMLALVSCGMELEGSYSGTVTDAIKIDDEDDVISVTFGAENSVSFTLKKKDGSTYAASGTYKLEAAEAHSGHSHGETLSFEISGENIGPLTFLQNNDFTYTLEKVSGKKTLTLSSHDYNEVVHLTEKK